LREGVSWNITRALVGFAKEVLKEDFKQIEDEIIHRDDPTVVKSIRDILQKNIEAFKNAQRIIIVACGTSWHAGLLAEYVIEELCRIPVEVEYASEFRYRNPIISSDDLVIAISQSGETDPGCRSHGCST
jgi:glucosamine--fructose-6-phosphate aminotransferase (isomerizing)